jgi:putative ABC transport system permease protein
VANAYWVATAAIGVAPVGTLGLLLALAVAEPTGRFVIPLGGMILGNAMNITSQTLNRFRAELRARRAEVDRPAGIRPDMEAGSTRSLAPR